MRDPNNVPVDIIVNNVLNIDRVQGNERNSGYESIVFN